GGRGGCGRDGCGGRRHRLALRVAVAVVVPVQPAGRRPALVRVVNVVTVTGYCGYCRRASPFAPSSRCVHWLVTVTTLTTGGSALRLVARLGVGAHPHPDAVVKIQPALGG